LIRVDPAGGLFRILRIPSILLASFSVFSASTSVGFLSATLEPHLRQFDLMPVSMGLMFVIEGGIYAITAPVWGYLCDRKVQPKIVTLIGSIFIVVGFLLIGPAPFLPLDT
jgi:drug/metabolite transporter superfamily protein YnfA